MVKAIMSSTLEGDLKDTSAAAIPAHAKSASLQALTQCYSTDLKGTFCK